MELLENFKKALEDDDGEYPNRKGFESHTNACNERVATAEIRKIEDEQQSENFIIIDSNNNNKYNTR
ncbi:unnamed protein product [Rhizophagus irregularis]|uniref:Uncharacterized protein n=1 Tax=Rhizophagus irregularis TaxID=588596 RepID=A0A916E6Z3_9GLOM|nr:unnamed protein product [Rhizophagus irregularis]